MPTTQFKNLIYRISLPFLAPGSGKEPLLSMEGHHVHSVNSYVRLLRKHHVLGSAMIIADGIDSSLLLSCSDTPCHTAEKNTYFRVASITKMATALTMLTLIDQGTADPDAPITVYLPELASVEGTERISIRHLLSHTSGITDPLNMDQLLLNHRPVTEALNSNIRTEPGKSFQYSNLGFGLIGCLLEAIENKSVRNIMNDRVFQPLGMNATIDASTLDPAMIMPVTRILPYRPGCDLKITQLGSEPLDQVSPLFHFGHTAGSMYTDADSLFTMMKCIRDNGSPLLSVATGLEMKRKHAAYGKLSPSLTYGLGLLFIHDSAISSSRIIGHQGFAYGCADGSFIEEDTGRMMIMLNGGCSEARNGRLGLCNTDLMKWAFRKELPLWER